jgi:hypothetical protein
MARKRVFWLLLLLGAAAALPRAANADQNWQSSTAVWRAMDNCTRAAQRAFPDFTPEAHAQRQAYRQTCLRSQNLPGEPGAPPVPQQPVRQQ